MRVLEPAFERNHAQIGALQMGVRAEVAPTLAQFAHAHFVFIDLFHGHKTLGVAFCVVSFAVADDDARARVDGLIARNTRSHLCIDAELNRMELRGREAQRVEVDGVEEGGVSRLIR